MAEMDLIAPPKTVQAIFSLAPAYNAVNDLMLLNTAKDTSGFVEWVYQTLETLPSERLRTNKLAFALLYLPRYLAGKEWPSFPAWIDHLAALDPVQARDDELAQLAEKSDYVLEGKLLTPTQLLTDRSAYLSFMEQLYCLKGVESFETPFWEEVHALLNDPPAMLDLIITHLRTMWDEVIAPVWERNLPMLEESVAAFRTLDFGGMPTAEIFRRVTGRDLLTDWGKWQEEIEQIVFIPSAHIGPYLMILYHGEATMWIAFGARIPEGTTIVSPTLSRSELLMRLSALADDTRLLVLKLLSQRGELSAQEIMTELDLSQSAASRHLRQLTANGFLSVRRCEGAKCYDLSRKRIDETFAALKRFLQEVQS